MKNGAVTENKAMEILSEIRAVVEKHGLWMTHTEERKPGLSLIRVNEISIKIGGKMSHT